MPAVDNRAFPTSERWRINRNIFVLGVAFMIHFTAFHGTANLQSSVNSDAGMGTITLATIYGSLILSNIFLPTAVIRWLGCKWTVALSFLAYMPFIMAQFWPRPWTLIPAGLAVGLGGGPLWCAKCTYLSVVAESYSELSGISSEVLMVRFFGLFFLFYQLAQVWGNLISSTILSSTVGNSGLLNATTSKTESVDLETILNTCGARFCTGPGPEVNENLEPPPADKIHRITAIYLGCMMAAVIAVAFAVDSLKRYSRRPTTNEGLSGCSLLAVTLHHLKNRNQMLLLPVILFIGAEQAFMAADFTSAYLACAYGIQNIGYVMICFGVLNAIAAPLAGLLVKITGRYPVMIVALILHLSVMMTLLTWLPNPKESYMFFLIAAVWGSADAIWLVQVNALSGILFPGKEEAAFANFRLWEATGSVITYASSPYFCITTKLYVLIAILVVGMFCYTIIEYLEHKLKKESKVGRNQALVAYEDNNQM